MGTLNQQRFFVLAILIVEFIIYNLCYGGTTTEFSSKKYFPKTAEGKEEDLKTTKIPAEVFIAFKK
jgi:hypothetical protein